MTFRCLTSSRRICVFFSAGQQKHTDHAQFHHVGSEAGEQGEADQPSGGQRVAQPELQPVREMHALGVYFILCIRPRSKNRHL